VILDDVYTTGGSMHSFARALKEKGACRVHGVALIRTIGGTVYHDALRAHRSRETGLRWSPDARLIGAWSSADRKDGVAFVG